MPKLTDVLKYVLFVSILAAACSFSFALPGDRIEKMKIKADRSTYNYKQGISLFEGHVRVDQGTTHVTAEKVTTRRNNRHQMEEAIAYGVGNMAHFWTTPKPGDPVINATAKVIKFYPLTLNTTLEGDVVIKQGENVFQGQLIRYNMNDQTIIVPETKNGRAVLIYNPD